MYDLPSGRAGGWLERSKLARAVFGGFQIGGIFVAQTGQPVNLTNTAHFGRPNAIIGSPQAGRITGTTVPNRQVQIGLRFVF